MKKLIKRARSISLIILAMQAGFISPAPAQQTFVPEVGMNKIDTAQFVDATVLDAVHILSVMGGVNIVATKEAGEKEVSLYLKDTNVHSAIDMICRASGLWYRYNKMTKSYLVMTVDQYKEDVVVYREDFTRAFTLRHQNVVTAAKTIENLYGDRVELTLDADDDDYLGERGGSGTSSSSSSSSSSSTSSNSSSSNSDASSGKQERDLRPDTLTPQQLSVLGVASSGGVDRLTEGALKGIVNREPPIYVSVNKLHNILFVRTSDESAMGGIAKLIKQSDKPTRQVLLEMKVLELTIDDTFKSQFNIGSDFGKTSLLDSSNATQAANQFDIGNFADLGGQFLFKLMHEKIQVQMELLERENRINVLSTPLLLASNNREARLFIGEERPITTGIKVTTTQNTGQTGTSSEPITELQSIGDELVITPRINSDRTVTLHIEQLASTVLEDNAEILAVNSSGNLLTSTIDTVQSSEMQATVVAKDGLTVAVGGMIKRTRNDDEQKVPLLGDIPILGQLFKRTSDEDKKTEVVILITPHIMMNPEETERISRERMASLSSNPAMDGHGFEASKNQPLLPAGTTTQDLVKLVRYAAQAVRGIPDDLNGVQPWQLNMLSPVSLLVKDDLEMTPQFSFKRGDLYVTALVIENRSRQFAVLQEQALRGNWIAASFENKNLSPQGEANSWTHGYVLSNKPFLDVLATSGDLGLTQGSLQ